MINKSSRQGVIVFFCAALLACWPADSRDADGNREAFLSELVSRLDRHLAARVDPSTRGQSLGQILADARPADAPLLQLRFAAASPYLHPMDLQQFAWWWVAHDPVEAIKNPTTASTLPSDFWEVQVLRAWAMHDPESARLAWLEGACTAPNDLCFLALVVGWCDFGLGSGPGGDGVWQLVEQHAPGVLRQRAMDVLVARLIADRGTEKAIQFVESLDPDAPHRFKLQVFRRMATALAQRDLDIAGQWAEEQADGPWGDGLLRRVAVRKVARLGDAGMEWVLALPPGPQRDDAVQAAARRWIQVDRPSALRWFSQAPEHVALEPAWEVYAQVVVAEDPIRALEIVERIQNREGHDRALVSVVRLWLARSPAEANDWIARNNLAESLIVRIRAEPVRPARRKKRRS